MIKENNIELIAIGNGTPVVKLNNLFDVIKNII